MNKKHIGIGLVVIAGLLLYSASIDQTASTFDGTTFPGNIEAKLAEQVASMSWLPYAVAGAGVYLYWKG